MQSCIACMALYNMFYGFTKHFMFLFHFVLLNGAPKTKSRTQQSVCHKTPFTTMIPQYTILTLTRMQLSAAACQQDYCKSFIRIFVKLC